MEPGDKGRDHQSVGQSPSSTEVARKQKPKELSKPRAVRVEPGPCGGEEAKASSSSSTQSCGIQHKHREQSPHKRSHRRGAGEAKHRQEGGFWGVLDSRTRCPQPSSASAAWIGGWWVQ